MEFNHIAITVRNLEESIAFYTKFFGFTSDGSHEKPNGPRFCFLKRDSIRLELFEFKDPIPPEDSQTNLRVIGLRHIAFKVKDIKGIVAQLQKDGLPFDPIRGGTSCKYFAFATDPNGVSIELYEAN